MFKKFDSLTPKQQATRVFQFGLDNNLEIVSYGLAPNPNGFCFEVHGSTSDITINAFSKVLDSLSSETVLELKKLAF